MKNWLFPLLFVLCHAAKGQSRHSDISVHDPVIIRQDSMYYVFCTGQGITVWSSPDRTNWKKEPPVFDRWEDLGKIVQSGPGRDLWNAIDPNLALDEKGIPWLTFGSFCSGIKLVRLQEDLRAVANPQQWYTIAGRPRNAAIPDSSAGDAAIEAPFIFWNNKYFYLFVLFDYCCRGEKSTYKRMVGRSENIRGPYLDRDGTPMTLGGGSLVLEGNADWHGVGHNAVG